MRRTAPRPLRSPVPSSTRVTLRPGPQLDIPSWSLRTDQTCSTDFGTWAVAVTVVDIGTPRSGAVGRKLLLLAAQQPRGLFRVPRRAHVLGVGRGDPATTRLELADHLRRDANRDAVVRDLPADHGPGADHHVPADPRSGQHDRAVP